MLKRNPNRTKPYAQLRSKPPEQGKPRKPMRVRGVSNRSKERASWQREMIATYGYGEFCEWLGGCSNTFGIANAHRLKKTKITTVQMRGLQSFNPRQGRKVQLELIWQMK